MAGDGPFNTTMTSRFTVRAGQGWSAATDWLTPKSLLDSCPSWDMAGQFSDKELSEKGQVKEPHVDPWQEWKDASGKNLKQTAVLEIGSVAIRILEVNYFPCP